MYQLYFNENRWTIQKRTNVENQTSNDVRFWTEETFTKTINANFSKSIADKNVLLNEKVGNWKTILNFSNDKKQTQLQADLTPTIYDVLVYDYINYLTEDDNKAKKIELYNELISINQKQNNQNAVLYNELNLLNYKNSNISSSDFVNQKKSLATKYPQAWYSAYVYSSLATDLYDLEENKLENINQIFDIQKKINQLYPTSSEKID